MESLESLFEREVEDSEFDLLETLQARPDDWTSRLVEALELLEDPGNEECWHRAIVVCYWAIPRLDVLPLEKMELVARLYWCLIKGSDISDELENLVWSIAIGLKGVGYESEWDPIQDPEVKQYLAAMS